MTPQELLLKAADRISECGHHKGSYSKPGISMSVAPTCAYGAMSWVATKGYTAAYSDAWGYSEEAEGLIQQAAELLLVQVPENARGEFEHPFNIITYYNDREETSAEDVILAMKRAASG